ncbi:50S ribosomal protein L25 [Caldalkalibacillus thermarum TA2.A1]|uniref:Large ribosomal subunit protein bL25 n=1 Tax=Caldalkalibacillus thermarum (strain TA2.A1) TaxID=986075 RepID=F5L9Z1_CALTT|nr:50S ribosomal protein L25/general stress protein Ctc [Caldalkalibacillus thermarum]EGL81861.1 50S ribosomal protein L25 [Caldalkalibacillus thermarum TA2.A1]QZT34348.1 50S ribosomal protein L25/general stress protein Ctc [Caldalkalibacillus thermarum TA2.A1]
MVTFRAEERPDLRKSVRRKLRQSGKVPGIVYGKTIGSKPIQVQQNELHRLLKQHGKNTVINLELDGVKPTVMIGEIQRDPITEDVLHVDFYEIKMNEKKTFTVPLEIVGEGAVTKNGGVLQRHYQEIEVECLPKDLPESIPIDVSGLDIGDSVTVADLNLGDQIEVLLEPDTVLLTVTAPTPEEGPVDKHAGNEEPPELVERQEDAEE